MRKKTIKSLVLILFLIISINLSNAQNEIEDIKVGELNYGKIVFYLIIAIVIIAVLVSIILIYRYIKRRMLEKKWEQIRPSFKWEQ